MAVHADSHMDSYTCLPWLRVLVGNLETGLDLCLFLLALHSDAVCVVDDDSAFGNLNGGSATGVEIPAREVEGIRYRFVLHLVWRGLTGNFRPIQDNAFLGASITQHRLKGFT